MNKKCTEILKELEQQGKIKVNHDFKFPEPIPLEKKLKDMLEENVDEKYYLDDTKFENISVGKDFDVINGGKIGKMHDISRRSYHIDGLSPAMHTCGGGNTEPKITEPFCVASRGRNPKNPSDRTIGAPTEQRLEPKFDGTTNTITSVQKDNYVVEPNKHGIKKVGNIYPSGGQNGNVYDTTGVSPTLRSGQGVMGNGIGSNNAPKVTEGYRIRKLTPKDFMWYNGVYEERYKESREILQILQQKIGEEAFCEWAIRGLWCILSESVLWERVYAKGIFENWVKRPELVKFAYFGKNNQPIIPTQEQVRNMWVNWQDRYPSYRRELSEQQFRQLKSVVQKLPHQVASFQGFVQGLWKTYEGTGLLRQALSEIQKIWESDACWEIQWSDCRIRKLTPLSCWRLMGFDDSDFEKAEKVNSNTQLYKQAGNSICVNVLEAIIKNLLA